MDVKKWIGTAGCVAACAGLSVAENTARPNVLLIITDDQNPDTVSTYGGDVQTPWIDSLASNGIKFTNGNVVHSVCSPSRYAMLTGRYYDNSAGTDYLEMYPRGTYSCVNNFMNLESDGMNLPAVLQADGYYTGYIGKFHLIDHHLLYTSKEWEANGLQTYPMDADPREDADVNAKMKTNHEWWCNRMKSLGFDWADAIYPANLREGFNEYLDVHNVEWTADAAVRFIKERQGKDQPFFVCVATTYPHGPAPHATPDGEYKFSLDADVQMTGEGYVTDRDLSRVLAGETRESCKRFSGQGDVRAPTATWWDAAVGAVIQALKETGQYENTLVIYISDHGQTNGGKTTLYETGVHVPLLMQWPARFGGGRIYEHVVGSVDLAPTVMAACGVQKPADYHMDGVSLLPVLNGSDDPVREALFMQMGYAHGVKTDHWKYIAVRYPPEVEQMLSRGERDPAWKSWKEDEVPSRPNLMLHPELSRKARVGNPHYHDRNQLYNLQNDPKERTNLFAEMPEKGAQMKHLLDQAITTHIPHRPFGEFGPLGKPDAYRHVADVVIDEPSIKRKEPVAQEVSAPKVEGDMIAVTESWCEIQCPAVLKVGEPYALTLVTHGLSDGLKAATVMKALSKQGKESGIVGRAKRIDGIENEHEYTISVDMGEIPENVETVQCGVVISPNGRWEDRLFTVVVPGISIQR
jgi:arylsulfatase A-like enzyme